MFKTFLNLSGPKPWSDQFTVYVEQRGYNLFTLDEYESVLRDTGFVNIKPEDKTEMFTDYLIKEVEHLSNVKDEFINVKISLFLLIINVKISLFL